MLQGESLPRRLSDRRDRVAELLEPVVGEVLDNATRGRFLSPHAARHGDFLEEWSRIYERFGVPAEIGLAQAIVESGLNGRARSRARALGFCQWMPRNWSLLKRLSPYVIEGYNQTTQAPFCAAYLSILATMYGSFIPALSEHHAGGVNVGRTVINGERLGATDKREKYLRGSEFAKALRQVSIRRYRQLFRTYGPRSALYAEMVFGNVYNVRRLTLETPQSEVFAMRAPRNLAISAIAEATGLSPNELKRYNPALVRQVPRGANVYLPMHVEEFGPTCRSGIGPRRPSTRPSWTSFWGSRPRLRSGTRARSPSGSKRSPAARRHRDRGRDGHGDDYPLRDRQPCQQPPRRHLEEFRTSDRILGLFERGRQELAAQAGS